MRMRSIVVCIVGMCGMSMLSAAALGQSINIRFGASAGTPTATYAAAGGATMAGTWNSIPTVPVNALQSLVSVTGAPIAAQFYQNGSSNILAFNNPLTSGDDKRLMDSMYLSTNSPTDGCFWVQGLLLGPYEVTIYAMTPNNAALITRTRVDNATPGPVMVGGAWPGQHQSGATFSRFNVTTTDGTIAFHDGLAGANIQSGMNGVQLRFLGPCAPTITAQPSSVIRCPNGSAPFSITASGGVGGAGAINYQWQIQPITGGAFQAMGNDPGPLPCGGGAFSYASPINSASVNIGVRPCPGNPGAAQHFQLRCVASNSCGSSTSNEATYTICPADYNCSGSLTVNDIFDFLAAWFAGTPTANFNGVGGINVQDIFDFLTAWFVGC